MRVLGEPAPRVQWSFNDRPLTHSTAQIKTVEEENGWNRLIIENVQPEHSGMYTVFAEVQHFFTIYY